MLWDDLGLSRMFLDLKAALIICLKFQKLERIQCLLKINDNNHLINGDYHLIIRRLIFFHLTFGFSLTYLLLGLRFELTVGLYPKPHHQSKSNT